MAIYYPPPQPNIGGRQPLEPQKLPPSITAVPEDNPPFGLKQTLWPIISAWQLGPMPSQGIKPISSVLPGWSVDDPIFGLSNPSLALILRGWEPIVLPSQIKIYLSQAEIITADNPPFSSRGRDPLWNILTLWQLNQSTIQQREGLSGILSGEPEASTGINKHYFVHLVHLKRSNRRR